MQLGRMVDMVDQRGNTFEIDSSLQVTVDGRVGYIEENAHTFPGRVHIYVPELGYDVTRSLSEIEWLSDEARCWMAGFLAGQEPDLDEYLGINRIDYDDRPVPTSEEEERWRRFTAGFRATGVLSLPGLRPVTPLVITDAERAELRVDDVRPWAYAGERVWVPSGETWVEADPQPELDDGQLVGSVCAEREEHDLMQLETGWTICLDCAEVDPQY